ncbi:MAG: hypothetical protein M1815_001124 [Lichina confinis]|nr:MAG: hypothetical protein M1815_001124 [Lichina confinis]
MSEQAQRLGNPLQLRPAKPVRENGLNPDRTLLSEHTRGSARHRERDAAAPRPRPSSLTGHSVPSWHKAPLVLLPPSRTVQRGRRIAVVDTA